MRYALNLGHDALVNVFYSEPQRRICAQKVLEFNPHPFVGVSHDELAQQLSDKADNMIRANAEYLFSALGRTISYAQCGYLILIRFVTEKDVPNFVTVDFLIDPQIMFLEESNALQREKICA